MIRPRFLYTKLAVVISIICALGVGLAVDIVIARNRMMVSTGLDEYTLFFYRPVLDYWPYLLVIIGLTLALVQARRGLTWPVLVQIGVLALVLHLMDGSWRLHLVGACTGAILGLALHAKNPWQFKDKSIVWHALLGLIGGIYVIIVAFACYTILGVVVFLVGGRRAASVPYLSLYFKIMAVMFVCVWYAKYVLFWIAKLSR